MNTIAYTCLKTYRIKFSKQLFEQLKHLDWLAC